MIENQIINLYDPLLLFVKKRIHNNHDAEDLTQDVFFKLAKSNKEEIESLRSWIYTIARNSITDYYRKKRIHFDQIKAESYSFEEEYHHTATRDLSDCIAIFIDQLPDSYREILRLSELENVPQKEIAERMGINYVTVRSKIQRGRKKLKEKFFECCVIIQGGRGSIMEYHAKCNCKDC